MLIEFEIDNTDEIAGIGSLVVFDGRIQHGVDDVDPGEVMNFDAEGAALRRLRRRVGHSVMRTTQDREH